MRVGLIGAWLGLALAACPVEAAIPDDLCEGVGPADGVCGVYEAPEGRGLWGDLYSRFFEPLGFRRSVALVIGVSRYTGYPNLEAPVNDAERVRDFLIDEAGFDIVVTLTDRAATKGRIERLMGAHIPGLLEEDDRFLFYFSGHGDTRDLYGGRKRGYLVLSGAPERDWPEMIGMDRVGDWWENIAHARQSLWVLDACFSGLAGSQRKAPLEDKTRRRLAQRAHHLITAGTSGEESVAVGGASLFTRAFIEAARDAADLSIANTEPDGVISLKEIDLHVGKTLDREIAALNRSRLGNPYKMSPQMSEFGDTEGEFFFMSRSYRARASGISGEYDVIFGVPQTKGPEPRVAEIDIARLTATRPGPASGFREVLDAELGPRRIREVQKMLMALGFDPGPADGVVGPKTRAAIMDYQRSIGVAVTGSLSTTDEVALAEAYSRQPADDRLAMPDTRERPRVPSVEPTVGGAPEASRAVFRDCADCPEMVVIPAGEFVMGAPFEEAKSWQRSGDEGPQHRVAIPAFAVGKYEVTFEEWEACLIDGECDDYDAGWDRWRQPVINVPWMAAKDYVSWLSNKTGKPYRLLSEAEWEYAARAGTPTRYPWGDNISPKTANYRETDHNKAIEVGSYPPNPWGLHDMHGNVWEWVEDCWNESYDGAPTDGSAWTSGDCADRVLRGGSWYDSGVYIRSANRSGPSYPNNNIGFRVARTLSPSESVTPIQFISTPAEEFQLAYWREASHPGGNVIWTFQKKGELIFAGTKSGGVFVTSDGGESWEARNQGLPDFNNWTVDLKVFDNMIYRVGFDGIFVSSNDGQSWLDINSNLPDFWATAITKMDDRIFAETKSDGLYYSDNGGDGWEYAGNGLPEGADIEDLFSYNETILAAMRDRGLFKSIDSGVSWTQVTAGLPSKEFTINKIVANDGVIFLGTDKGVFRSVDQANSWEEANGGLREESSLRGVRSLFVNGDKIFASKYGEVFVSDDDGASWVGVGDGLPDGNIYAITTFNGEVIVGVGEGAVWKIRYPGVD